MESTPATGSGPGREARRSDLRERLGLAAVQVGAPEGAGSDVGEARRRLLGMWPGILGGWRQLAGLDRQLAELRDKLESLPRWQVLQGYRLKAEEQRLEEERATRRTRFEGLFESALDNYQQLLEAGATVEFLDSPAP